MTSTTIKDMFNSTNSNTIDELSPYAKKEILRSIHENYEIIFMREIYIRKELSCAQDAEKSHHIKLQGPNHKKGAYEPLVFWAEEDVEIIQRDISSI